MSDENIKVTNHNLPGPPVTELAQSALDNWATAAGWVPVQPGDEPAPLYAVNNEDLTVPAAPDVSTNPPPPPPPPADTTKLTTEV